MNDTTLDYLMSKFESRRGDKRSKEYTRDRRDYEDSRQSSSSRDYGGKGSVDFEGSMDFRDRPEHWGSDGRYAKDYRDSKEHSSHPYYDERGMRDFHKGPKLSKSDIHRWKQMMENEDGTHGPHYDMQQIMSVADKMDVHFDDFDEKEFCIAVNMMYSDYCKVARKYVAPDKELAFFAELAKAFLEDEDGPEASDKLALYFHCIVDG